VTYGTTLLFGPASYSLGIVCYKFWNKFKFEFSLNCQWVQTFLKISDKFSNIPSSHGILEYEFILIHLYSNIRSSFTSRRRDLVYFIPKRAGHLSILLPLSQLQHCTKLSKECSIQLTCMHHLPKSKKIFEMVLSNGLKKPEN
jgi:hypothetical protein